MPSPMLASDVANPDFVGATHPDAMLHVDFFWHTPPDGIQVNKDTGETKIVKLERMPYIRIQAPGDKTSTIETAVREEHKRRWPQQWMYWQMKEGLIHADDNIPGWKIEEWNYLNPEQVRELKYLRFNVVEQIAGASDEQVQRLGMGGMALREEARRAMRDRMGAEVKSALQAKDAELTDLRSQMAKMQEQMQQLLEAATKPPAVATTQRETLGVRK